MIYIGCPEKVATGGTELLCQLYFKLKKIGVESKIFYYDLSSNEPIPERFKKYMIEYTDKIIDNEKNIIIIPEVNVEELNKYRKIKKYIWWLSVDNYALKYSNYFFKFKWKDYKIIKKIKAILKISFMIPLGEKETLNFYDNKIKHLVQSKYAEEFLKNKGVKQENIFYLSDYLNEDFFIKDISIKNRENNILYNPKKGIKVTRKIMKLFPQYNYIPLQNMTPIELKELYLKSKIYIDFGNHPGKDRIPREAAVLGCIVLTNKRGSAKYFEDVSIPEKYKFFDNDIKKLGNNIEYIFNNYEKVLKEYEFYRNKIKNEEKIFEKEILDLIKSLKK